MNVAVLLPAFISFEELTVILLISVLIFGPKKIPEIARGLGEGIRAMKKATDDIKQELMQPIEEIQEDIQQKINEPMKDINPIQDIQDALNEEIDSIPNPTKTIQENLDDIVGPIKRN